MKYERGKRLEERIKERVAQIVLFELHDPRIGFVTVTKAVLARDYSTVKVFYSVLGTEGDRSRVAHALADARGPVQHELGKVLETKMVPHLEFVFDQSVEGAFKMERLLDDLKKQRGEPEAGAAEAPPPAADTDDEAAPDEEADSGDEDAKEKNA